MADNEELKDQPGSTELPVDEKVEAVDPFGPDATRVALGPLEGVDEETEEKVAETPSTPTDSKTTEATTQTPETPTTETLKEPTPPVSAPVDPRVQQELETLRQQNRQTLQHLSQQQAAALEQQNQQTLATFTAQLQKNIEEKYGLAPEQAADLAREQAQAEFQKYTVQEAERKLERQAKEIVAGRIANEFNVPVDTLLQYNSPEAMRGVAESLTAQSKKDARIAQLEAENAKLKKAQLPAGQRFDSGPGVVRSGSNRADALRRYADGETLSEKELAGLFGK